MKIISMFSLIFLLNCSLKSNSSPKVERESGIRNQYTKHESFKIVENDCTYAVLIKMNANDQSLSIWSGKNLQTNEGVLVAGREGEACGDLNTYKRNVTFLLEDIKKEFPALKISHYKLSNKGSYKGHLLAPFHEKLAELSSVDKEFKELQRYGEKKVSLNQIFNRLTETNHLFDEYIKIHQSIGLNLKFNSAEKVFRDRVEFSPKKDQFLKIGAGLKDQYISGAGIYHFDIIDPLDKVIETKAFSVSVPTDWFSQINDFISKPIPVVWNNDKISKTSTASVLLTPIKEMDTSKTYFSVMDINPGFKLKPSLPNQYWGGREWIMSEKFCDQSRQTVCLAMQTSNKERHVLVLAASPANESNKQREMFFRLTRSLEIK